MRGKHFGKPRAACMQDYAVYVVAVFVVVVVVVVGCCCCCCCFFFCAGLDWSSGLIWRWVIMGLLRML